MTTNKDHVLSFYLNRETPSIVKAEGVYLYDDQDNCIIDASGGAIVCSIGHGVKEVTDAAAKQMEKVAFVFRRAFSTPALEEAAAKVCETTHGDMDRVFFVCGGSEATETAIKLARKYHIDNGNPVATTVVCRVIDYIKEHNLIERCAEIGEYLGRQLQTLRSHPTVGDVRGRGLQWGVEFVRDKETKESLDPQIHFSQQIQDEALLRGVHIESSSGCNRGQAGDTIIFGPPFIITKTQIDDLITVIDETITCVEKKAGF